MGHPVLTQIECYMNGEAYRDPTDTALRSCYSVGPDTVPVDLGIVLGPMHVFAFYSLPKQANQF